MKNEELTMSNEEAREVLSKLNIAVAADATPILSKNQVLEATSMAIKALEQIRWISCSERLPEKYGCYLITTKIEIPDLKPYYEVRIAKFDGEHFDIGYIGNDIGVIAWMPLIQPYKENEEE